MILFAIIIAVAGSFLVAMPTRPVRAWGFLLFLVADLIWIDRGVSTQDWAVTLQFLLFGGAAVVGLMNNVQFKRK